MKSLIRILIERAQPGDSKAVREHIARGERIRDLIEARFHIGHPRQWKAKHLRWFLERALPDVSSATRYNYYRTVRVMVAVLEYWPEWEPHLRGAWQTPTGAAMKKGAGGRPPKLAHRSHKS